MDPDENARRQVALAQRILHDEPTSARAVQLAELVLALAHWRGGGGFEPRWHEIVGAIHGA